MNIHWLLLKLSASKRNNKNVNIIFSNENISREKNINYKSKKNTNTSTENNTYKIAICETEKTCVVYKLSYPVYDCKPACVDLHGTHLRTYTNANTF